MRFHKSVCTLLVCTTLGFLAGADPITNQSDERAEENVIENTIANHRVLEVMRLTREHRIFRRGLLVEDDDGKLVEITLDDDDYPAESQQEMMSRLHDRVRFHLYTRKNPHNHQSLWINDKDSLATSNFNADKPTHFVTHGWINSGSSPACTLIRDAYLKNGDFNVIVVDWSRITLRPYGWAAAHVVMVGKHVAQMIDFLESHAGLNTDKTTLAGHSLGAHVMGLGGYYANGTINQVVGLDPALPLFAFAAVGSRISNKDAKHVQIVHTNAGLLGYPTDIGHSDFYPNGGSWQHGCFIDFGGACSHARSFRFFAESINSPKGFYGQPCKSFLAYILGHCKTQKKAIMGGRLIDFAGAGKYFLSTRSLPPYAKGR